MNSLFPENIARATLKLSDVGARLLGGPSRTEAVALLKRRGFSQREIVELSGMTCKDCTSFLKRTPRHCGLSIVAVDEESRPCNFFKENECP